MTTYPYYQPQTPQMSANPQNYFSNPYFQQPQQNTMQGTQQDERIWVQGEAGANAYLVAPNSFVRLWDSQASVFYEKKADASGRPTTDVYEYTLRSAQKVQNGPETASLSISLTEQIKGLEKRIDALENREVKKDAKKSKSTTDDSEV